MEHLMMTSIIPALRDTTCFAEELQSSDTLSDGCLVSYLHLFVLPETKFEMLRNRIYIPGTADCNGLTMICMMRWFNYKVERIFKNMQEIREYIFAFVCAQDLLRKSNRTLQLGGGSKFANAFAHAIFCAFKCEFTFVRACAYLAVCV